MGTAVLGAGPAGLTAAYVLALRGVPATIYEADGTVGGIAKTVEYNGYRFDLGGHRFFTKFAQVQRLWEEMLGDELLVRPRLSRIYYDGKYLAYPLQARDVVARLGVLESVLCSLSYFRSRLSPSRHEIETFEDFATKNFGTRIYDVFFRTYTEKVWGVPGSEIHSEWGAQRIKDFSFWKALLAALHLTRTNPTTLIEEFHYPRLGPGQMWEAFEARLAERGIPVHRHHRALTIHHDHNVVVGVTMQHDGRTIDVPVDAVLSTIALSELVLSLDPAPPQEIVEAAERLRYRSLCLVALVIDREEPFPDNWIYLHDPGVARRPRPELRRVEPRHGRAGEDVPRRRVLHFRGRRHVGDARRGGGRAGHGRARHASVSWTRKDVIDGVKVRVPKAYPMYVGRYREDVAELRGYLAAFDNLKTFGRNGLHRYNNQDHSMWTAILATLNLVDGTEYDVWSVNTEAEYHEEGEAVDSLLDVDLVS